MFTAYNVNHFGPNIDHPKPLCQSAIHVIRKTYDSPTIRQMGKSITPKIAPYMHTLVLIIELVPHYTKLIFQIQILFNKRWLRTRFILRKIINWDWDMDN